jgi:hypothetical protein
MPQILIDWNAWWMSFWIEHPALFWIALAACVAPTVAYNIWKRL